MLLNDDHDDSPVEQDCILSDCDDGEEDNSEICEEMNIFAANDAAESTKGIGRSALKGSQAASPRSESPIRSCLLLYPNGLAQPGYICYRYNDMRVLFSSPDRHVYSPCASSSAAKVHPDLTEPALLEVESVPF